MKKYSIFILAIAILMVAGIALAQQDHDDNEDVPDGMEVIQVSDGYRMIVLKGAKVEQVGAQIKVEDPGVYFMKKLRVIEDQIKEIEEKQNNFIEKFKLGGNDEGQIIDKIDEKIEDVKEDIFSDLDKLQSSLDNLEKKQSYLQNEVSSLKEILNRIQVNQKLKEIKGKAGEVGRPSP